MGENLVGGEVPGVGQVGQKGLDRGVAEAETRAALLLLEQLGHRHRQALLLSAQSTPALVPHRFLVSFTSRSRTQ